MRWMKWFTGFLLTLIVVFSLGACGSSLEKPTGLEDTDNQQAEIDNQGKNDEELADEKSVNDEEQETTDDVEAETSKAEAESDENENGSKTDSVSENKNKSNPDSKTTNKKTASNDNKRSKKSSPASDSKETKDKSVKKSNKSMSDSSKNKPKKEKSKKNPEKEKDKPKPDPKPKKDTITHSIVISEETKEIPLPPTEMEIKNGDTVLEALIAITMENKIHMDYRGGQGATAYVQGMGNVYEFDRGQGSGWMYSINGIFPDRGAGVVPLCDGDRVEWLYTTNLGEDLGADLKPVRRDGKCPK